MQYLSTRGVPPSRRFSDILLEGLAPDGGLYLPEHYPSFSPTQLASWRHLNYPQLAYEVTRLYIDDIPADDLRPLCQQAYDASVFDHPDIVSFRPSTSNTFTNTFILGLSHGPTLAFKDIAMQWLGQLFPYELARRNQTLNIVGATSGDTGSAAEHAMRGKPRIRVFMMSPQGRMSPFQQAQMFGIQEANIHNLVVAGVFDDCQDLVKAVCMDPEFKERYHLGVVNSINWARVLAQVVYYVFAYLRALDTLPPPSQARATSENPLTDWPLIDVAVPSGNFGNVCAAHIARQMGLPLGQLVVATNENDVLDEFFKTGIYRPRSAQATHITSSPSMDISKASNFERFVFDLLNRDAQRLTALFSDVLPRQGFFDLSLTPEFQGLRARFGFVSGKSTHTDRLNTMRQTHKETGDFIDPHTADALYVAQSYSYRQAERPMVVLETALATKFEATIQEALGFIPPRPAAWVGLEDQPQRVHALPVEVTALKMYIKTNLKK
jgi:threonine synthase